MTTPRTVRVHLRIIPDEPVTGEWCDECLLPSAIRYPFKGVTEAGSVIVSSPGPTICTECGGSSERTETP